MWPRKTPRTPPHQPGKTEDENVPHDDPKNDAENAVNSGDVQEPRDDAGFEDEAADRIEALEAQLREANSRALRALADFQNFQRRAAQNEVVARQQGTGVLAMGVVAVLDTFDLALAQDMSRTSAEQIVAGIRVIRAELMKALAQQGVGVIHPAPDDEFTPGRHEAIMQQEAEGVEPGNVVFTLQPGYTLGGAAGERVLRPAKVSVAPRE